MEERRSDFIAFLSLHVTALQENINLGLRFFLHARIPVRILLSEVVPAT